MLRHEWRADLSVEDLISLSQSLDRMLTQIRTERQIKPPTLCCPKCGKRVPAAEPRVSVHATILAAGRFGIAAPAAVKLQERSWRKVRSETGLDLYGSPAARQPGSGVARIGHGCQPSEKAMGGQP